MTQHILHGTFKHFGFHQSLFNSLCQELIVFTSGEVHIVAIIDSSSCLLYGIFIAWQLIDSGIIAHYHTIKTYIVAQDILQNLAIGHAISAMHSMITRHHHFAICQANHSLVRQQNLFNHLFFIGIATATISQVVFRACANAFCQIALL